MIKNKMDAGADNLTPSIPQYFSWINNTNEGSTEAHTLVNLDFFKYLKDKYGMQLKIYAWDAGNFDGASGGYGNLNGEKFKSQYPEGYKNVVAKARELGIDMGLWGSPDGYGDSPEEEQERYDFFVHLCRDYNFGLFKLDGVCGTLRPEKAETFARMLKECRKHNPNLIVLNHRLNFYEAEKHVTTYLWNGDETYVDVLSCNKQTAMHHRGFMFTRGHTDNLERLAEDHGVCISSNVDYFEDELIYQAFNRSLILAPEIYGNPWFMRDDELPKLARIYNLHRRNAHILTKGTLLPHTYGANPCSRGTDTKRFVATGNNSWEPVTIKLNIAEVGIKTDSPVVVSIHHPYEEYLGTFSSTDTVEITLMPFRAALIEVATPQCAEPILTSCKYEIIVEGDDGTPKEIKILECDGSDISLLKNGMESPFRKGEKISIAEGAPLFLGALSNQVQKPENGRLLYESAMFAISNDCLEAQSIRRSGETQIPQVQVARDAFFNQEIYILRGCESRYMFDGKEDTFFDSQSKTYCDNDLRINGGCLRIDLGSELDCDSIEVEFFSPDYPTREVEVQKLPLTAEYSRNLADWKSTDLVKARVANDDFTAKIVRFTVHDCYHLHGKKLVASYGVNDKIRYFALEKPVDRIYAVRAMKDGKALPLISPRGNNMQAHYRYKSIAVCKFSEFTLPEYKKNARLTVAVEGTHGEECVYCVAELDGKLLGFPERAPDYKANQWEHRVCGTDSNNTFFLPLPEGAQGKAIKVYAIFTDKRKAESTTCNVYICDKH
ncbi:MAG: hypothetical protein IKV44_02315 [Clostridia bacterium]|nr:hypothetical protein [Clostridia bacterium]